MKKLLALVCLFLLFCLPAVAEGQNLLKNGDFSDLLTGNNPNSWQKSMWVSAEASTITIDPLADNPCVMVYSDRENDARLSQQAAVSPNTLYCLTARVKAAGVPEGLTGANISVAGCYDVFPSLSDTGGQWETLTVYGKTGDTQTTLTVYLRLGGYNALSTGRVWFDDVCLAKAAAAPEGEKIYDFTDHTAAAAPKEAEEEAPARRTPLLLLFISLSVLLAAALFTRRHSLPASSAVYKKLFPYLVFAALAGRLAAACFCPGFYIDVTTLRIWSDRVASLGAGSFYSESGYTVFPPLTVLLLWPVGLLRTLLGFGAGSLPHRLLLRLPGILADGAVAMLLYRLTAKREGHSRNAFLLGAAWLLLPGVWVNAALWGQYASLFAGLLVLSFLLAREGKAVRSLCLFAAAFLTTTEYTFLLLPLLLFLVLVLAKNAKPMRILSGSAAAAGLCYAVTLCFFHTDALAPFRALYRMYGALPQYLTRNGLNFYTLLGMNWQSIAAQQAAVIIGLILCGAGVLLSLLVYKKRNHLFLALSCLALWLCCFMPGLCERSGFPVLLLLLCACVETKDNKIVAAALAFSLLLFLNQALVLQGGLGSGGGYHLQESESWLNISLSALSVAIALFVSAAALFPGLGIKKKPSVPCPLPQAQRLGKKDIAWMLIFTALYACLAFANQGTTNTPVTQWCSSKTGENVVFDLGQTRTFRLTYYGGISNNNFTLSFSDDGESWTEPVYAGYENGNMYRWRWFAPCTEENEPLYMEENDHTYHGVVYASTDNYYPCQTARYVRMTASSAFVKLYEVGFLGEDGTVYPVESITSAGGSGEYAYDPALLADEMQTVPAVPSSQSGMYFDELYHARTAYEIINGQSIYEWTHPPLGKVIMSLGIRLFGMTPFGWRFTGTLFGCLMVPVMYLLAHALTHRRSLSVLATALLCLDFMHLVQTRIATVDSYAVLFIMVMFLLMYRYMATPWQGKGFRRSLLLLAACGVFMGLACASKWIGAYGGIGLAVLFFWTLGCRIGENKAAPETGFRKKVLVTLLWCCLFFVVVPVVIYVLSYIPQLAYDGGFSLAKVWEQQKSMLSYHSGLTGSTHPYASPWYEWAVIAWPMWFFGGSAYLPSDQTATIVCMGNPILWWAGLAAVLYFSFLFGFTKKLRRQEGAVFVSYFSVYLPWALITRSTYIYHYFAAVPFLLLLLVLMLGRVEERSKKVFRILVSALLISALVLLVLYYPMLTGLPISRSYAQALSWFGWKIY